MRRVIGTLSLVLVLAVFPLVALPADDKTTSEPKLQTYEAPDKSFRVSYPHGWEPTKNPGPMGVVAFINPNDKGNSEAIAINKGPPAADLAKWAEQVRSTMKLAQPKFKIIHDAEHKAGDKKAWRFVFEDDESRLVQYLLLGNGSGYALTIAFPATKYDQKLPLAEKVAASFVIGTKKQ